MSANELSLWWAGEAESIFIYYVTGTMALSFFITITITRSLQRKQPRILELVHEDFQSEPLLTYLLAVTTSSARGSGCPGDAKVFLQVQGSYRSSQHFQLTTNHATTSALQRASTDIFMCKLPETLGTLKGVKLVIAGLEKNKNWRVERVQSYQPATGVRQELPVEVVVAEVFTQTYDGRLLDKCLFQRLKHTLCQNHHWLSATYTTVRFGAYTEVVHVLLLFLSIFTQLCLTLVFYIIFPRADGIHETWLLVGGVLAPCCSSCLVLCLEIVLRQVRSSENNPGSAYKKIMLERRITSDADLADMMHKSSEEPQFNYDQKQLFLLNNEDPDFVSEGLYSSDGVDGDMPLYLRLLLEALRGKNYAWLSRLKSTPEIEMTTTCSDISINLQHDLLEEIFQAVEVSSFSSFSKFCLKRVLSKQAAMGDGHLSKMSVQQSGPLHPGWSAISFSDTFFLDRPDSAYDMDLFKSAPDSAHDTDLFKSAVEIPAVPCYKSRVGDFAVSQPRSSQQWQEMQKKWSRTFMQNLINEVEVFRENCVGGPISISNKLGELVSWLEELCHRIALAASLLRPQLDQELDGCPELLQLYGHMTTEVLVGQVEAVYDVLSRNDVISLGDVAVLSHKLIAAIQQAAHCMVYSVASDHWDWRQLCLLRSLDPNEEFKYVAGVFFSRCFQLSIKFDDNTWAYFKTLLQQFSSSDPYLPVLELLTYIDKQLEEESMLDIVVRRLYNLVVHDAKEEVWRELTDPLHIFTEMLVRQQVLDALQDDVERALHSKQKLDERYFLIAEKPRSRIQQLIEKRYLLDKAGEKRKFKRACISATEQEKAREESKWLVIHSKTVSGVLERVKKRWVRQGLKLTLKAEKLVVKAFLHPQVIQSHEDLAREGFMFDHYLHLKRTEQRVALMLRDRVLDLAEMLVSEMASDQSWDCPHSLDTQLLDVIAEDAIAKTDFLVQLVRDDLPDILEGAVIHELFTGDRAHLGMIDTHLMSSDNLENLNMSAILQHSLTIPDDITYPMSVVNEQHPQLTTERLGNPAKEMTEKSIIAYIRNVMLPLKNRLLTFKMREAILDETCQLGYLDHQTQKRDRLCEIHLNNVIDAQFVREELDDSHTLTQAGLYQLEHDMMRQSEKPLPGMGRTVVIWLCLVLIIWCLTYTTLVGSQLTTVQNQEWVAHFLLSVGIWGFILEPLRVATVGLILGF